MSTAPFLLCLLKRIIYLWMYLLSTFVAYIALKMPLSVVLSSIYSAMLEHVCIPKQGTVNITDNPGYDWLHLWHMRNTHSVLGISLWVSFTSPCWGMSLSGRLAQWNTHSEFQLGLVSKSNCCIPFETVLFWLSCAKLALLLQTSLRLAVLCILGRTTFCMGLLPSRIQM